MQQVPESFADGAGRVGQLGRDTACFGRQVGGGQDPVDHFPERQRLAIGDEIDFAGYAFSCCQTIGGQQMGLGGPSKLEIL